MSMPLIWDIMFGLYFIAMAWGIVYLPPIISILRYQEWNTKKTYRWAFETSLGLSLIPILNLFFVAAGIAIMWKVHTLSKDYEGVEEEREEFNTQMRESAKGNDIDKLP